MFRRWLLSQLTHQPAMMRGRVRSHHPEHRRGKGAFALRSAKFGTPRGQRAWAGNKRIQAALLTPQKNGSGPFTIPPTFLRQA